MTRYRFGGDITHLVTREDFSLGGALKIAPNAPIQFHLERVGGLPVEDYMTDPEGTGTYDTPAAVITARPTGYLPNFEGPEDVTILYYDPNPDDDDVQRVRLEAWDVPIANLPISSSTEFGLSRKATAEEVDAGASDIPFVTPLRLAVTTLFAKAKNTVVNLTGATDSAATYTIIDDGSNQTTWPDRLTFTWTGLVKAGRFDKYGQLIAGAAKASTTALRVENLNASPTGNLIEAGVNGNLAGFQVRPDTTVIARNIFGSTPLVLEADEVPGVNTPDKTLIARIQGTGTTDPGGGGEDPGTEEPPTTLLLKDHPHEGTVGQSPTATQEGYTSRGGTAVPVYVTGGAVGASAIQWGAGVTGNFTDTFTAQDSDLYVRFYFRQGTNGTGSSSVLWNAAIGVEVRVRTNELALLDITPIESVGPVLNPKPALGVWWRGLWRIGTTTSTLQLWTTDPASTGAPDTTLDLTYAAPKARPTSLSLGQRTTSGGQHAIDAVAIGTAPIGPVI